MNREYKDWRIEVNSYRSEGGKWRPDIRLWTRVGGTAYEKNPTAPAEWLFDSPEDSDEHGYQLAVDWIDSHG